MSLFAEEMGRLRRLAIRACLQFGSKVSRFELEVGGGVLKGLLLLLLSLWITRTSSKPWRGVQVGPRQRSKW